MIYFLLIIFTIIILFIYFKQEKFCKPITADDKVWEDEDIIKYNNCYAYAFRDLKLNRKTKPQPGFKNNLTPLTKNQYNCQNFIERILLDYPNAEYMGKNYINCTDCKNSVFLALDNKGLKQDYHFYRQNSDGFWTHKPGSEEVLHTDSLGNKIVNPKFSNRKYKNYNYKTSCGFFCID